MRPTFRCLAALAFAAIATPAARATEFEWSGEYRLRSESIERSLRGQRVQWDFLQRVRVGVRATLGPEISAFAQVQDARLWGAEGSTLADLGNLDLHQGYVQAEPSAAPGLRLRLGRQELSYGDERIVGAGAFANTGRAFDAVLVRFGRGGYTGDFAAARAADAAAVAAGNDDVFLHYSRFTDGDASRGIEGYAMHRASAGARFETTLGQRGFASAGAFRVVEESAFQVGRREGRDLRAFLVAANGKLQAHRRCAVGIGLDWLSGDDPAHAGDGFFDTARVFGTGHRLYGRLDLAEAIAGKAGLLDPYAWIEIEGPGRTRARFDAHVFAVHRDENPQADGTRPGGAGESRLGTEFDLYIQVPWQSVRFEALAAVFLPGERLDAVGLEREAWFGYLSTLVVF